MSTPKIDDSCMGYCRDCDTFHSIGPGNAREYARSMMDEFRRLRRLDYTLPDGEADPKLSFDYLLADDRGHMFGVLECEHPNGDRTMLRAYSSLRDGIRHIDGWAPSILDDEVWDKDVLPGQTRIKELTQMIRDQQTPPNQVQALRQERRRFSQELTRHLREKLVFTNFRGDRRPLADAFIAGDHPPGGVGDCCGPKLLNHAARMGWKPIGLSEFYWGHPTPTANRREGEFYPCCAEKCQPILGFILCGIDELT